MEQYLAHSEIIDWKHPKILAHARSLAGGSRSVQAIAKRCFEWVRDNIKHSRDFRLQPVTCSASEVFEEGSGYCYAKSHLLAAMLRANEIPAGLCDQRLSRDDNGPPYCLHGLNAVLLPEYGWYRVDPRGNRAGVNAQFVPPVEQLAFPIALAGEADLPEVWAEPLPVVVEALRRYRTSDMLWANLPDLELWATEDRANQAVKPTR